jgi:hypothetical protein
MLHNVIFNEEQWLTYQTYNIKEIIFYYGIRCRLYLLKGETVMVFNTTFNNISAVSWRSVLLVEESESTRGKPATCRKSTTNFIT